MRIRVASRAGTLVATTTTSTVPIGIRASVGQGATTASSVVPLVIQARARYSPTPSGTARSEATSAMTALALTTVEVICLA